MTSNKGFLGKIGQILLGSSVGLPIEIKKTKMGAVALILGVLSIEELSSETVKLATHFGRICFNGEGLLLSVFSERAVEIIGKIKGVELYYGRK